jgi:hypothetical protein
MVTSDRHPRILLRETRSNWAAWLGIGLIRAALAGLFIPTGLAKRCPGAPCFDGVPWPWQSHFSLTSPCY